ncbi:hypothetical protein BOTBODRAFT_28517 [Botryobasidium botryosum FD-172 SS1]|uniref:Uncharacterized protein n=1 Tax=Botryobasidium botryosum (strain FD-172 SS1) TaxID=930990 RepID=A0A067N5H6_BOTB1|nr:hypothetical protein BOTBODRAFT_28517 [Botryobasidium botryosum FD-172 SS1]
MGHGLPQNCARLLAVSYAELVPHCAPQNRGEFPFGHHATTLNTSYITSFYVRRFKGPLVVRLPAVPANQLYL